PWLRERALRQLEAVVEQELADRLLRAEELVARAVGLEVVTGDHRDRGAANHPLHAAHRERFGPLDVHADASTRFYAELRGEIVEARAANPYRAVRRAGR